MLSVPKSIIQDQTFSDYDNELNIFSPAKTCFRLYPVVALLRRVGARFMLHKGFGCLVKWRRSPNVLFVSVSAESNGARPNSLNLFVTLELVAELPLFQASCASCSMFVAETTPCVCSLLCAVLLVARRARHTSCLRWPLPQVQLCKHNSDQLQACANTSTNTSTSTNNDTATIM